MGRATRDFAEAAHALATYEPPSLPEVVQELVGPPDYSKQSRRLSRFRFLLSDAGVVFDIVRPSETAAPEDNTVTIQMSRYTPGTGFPVGPLQGRIFDSDFWLRDGDTRLTEARSELFLPEHKKLLVEAGLGELVVDGFETEFEPYTPYSRYVDSRLVREALPQLPNQLIELAMRP